MLRVTAKINIGAGGGKLQSATNTISGINGSSTISEVIGHHTQIQKPFFLGRSRLGGGQCYTKKANFYIGKVPSDSQGNFPVSSPYIITVNGNDITQLTIVFNKEKNEYPRAIFVDNKKIADDDPQWVINLDKADTHTIRHTIRIDNWNTPNSPLVISSIYTDLSIDIDDSNLLSFERTIMSKGNISQPSFGIISNSGSLSFIDKDGEILDLVAQQLVNSGNVISIYLENPQYGTSEQIGYFNSRQWSYTNSQSLVDITLKDNLEEWQSINVPAINYTPTISTEQTAEWLYRYLQDENITPAKFNMQAFEDLDEQTQAVLSNTIIQYPILESDNLWNAWDKLCQLCFLNIYMDNSGQTVCKYSGG